ncbi:MAG: OmpH family outer membrane protein [Gammaproteobacteria bacterium]|nr:OmpH family outer membrane protein [Gammaproteobacteria bacterium]
MHRLTGIFIIALLCLNAGAIHAADLNIGVVNIARLLDEAPQAKSAMKALQDEFAPRQRDIESEQQSVQSEQEKLGRDAAVMGETERRDAERNLREKARDLARKQNEYLEDLNLRRNEELNRLQRVLLEEVQTFARQENYDLIVGDGVLFASAGVDVTAQVLAGLERSFRASN